MEIYRIDASHARMAQAEIMAVASTARVGLQGPFAAVEGGPRDKGRLAYTQAAYDILFTAAPHDLLARIAAFAWQDRIAMPYRVTNLAAAVSTQAAADAIWRAQAQPQVDLVHPRTRIVLLPFAGEVAATLQTFENREDFEARRAHLRPALHPSGLHPKLARCMVNLSGAGTSRGPLPALVASLHGSIDAAARVRTPPGNVAPREDRIRQAGTAVAPELLDPFCGAGGLLIEAGLMGLDAAGSDLDARQVARAQENLRGFGLRRIPVRRADALEWQEPAAAIVADLPCGRNTSPQDFEQLYAKFVRHAVRLTSKMVLGLLSTVPLRVGGTPWRIAFEDEYYMHRSLSKRIVVLERTNP